MPKGPHSTIDGALASYPAAPGSIPGIPKKNSDKRIVHVAELNRQRCCLEQWTTEA